MHLKQGGCINLVEIGSRNVTGDGIGEGILTLMVINMVEWRVATCDLTGGEPIMKVCWKIGEWDGR